MSGEADTALGPWRKAWLGWEGGYGNGGKAAPETRGRSPSSLLTMDVVGDRQGKPGQGWGLPEQGPHSHLGK